MGTKFAKRLKALDVRRNMSDFDRFKTTLARMKRSKEVRMILNKTVKGGKIYTNRSVKEKYGFVGKKEKKHSLFTRFVQPGRLCMITYGPLAFKNCIIVDIVDQKRVIVDGPYEETGVPRHMTLVKRLRLSKFRIPMSRGLKAKHIKEACATTKIFEKWEETKFAKRLKALEVRRNMSDFDRFKTTLARMKRSKEVRM